MLRGHAGRLPGLGVSSFCLSWNAVRRLLNLLNRVTADELRRETYWLQSFK